MKNISKKIISVLLAALMLCSAGVCAFAAPDTEYLHFDSVFAIGDSNAMGYGLTGYQDYANKPYLHFIEGTFSYHVAEALNIPYENRYGLTYPALRTQDALHFLGNDIDVSADPFYVNPQFYSWWISPMVADAGADGQSFVRELSEKPGDKKLVILYAGASDVFYSSIRETVQDFGTSDIDDIEALAAQMWENYRKFLENFPKLVEHIYSLNKNCTIVIVGTFNPMKDLKIKSGDALPAFEAVSAISELMNSHYRAWAKEYGCLYADISNVETATLEKEITYDSFTTIDPVAVYHATPEGYKYIARQILKQLEAEKKPVTADIVIDLGSVGSIGSVKVDGMTVNNYSFDSETHTLTIPYSYTTARSVTVTENRSDGSVYLVSYTLTWGENGYTAHRTFVTKDAKLTFTRIVDYIRNAIRKIFSSLFSFC